VLAPHEQHETPKALKPEPETHFWLRCDTEKPYTRVVSVVGDRSSSARRPRTQFRNWSLQRVRAQRGRAVAAGGAAVAVRRAGGGGGCRFS
jgi:hypothetical protein